MYSILQSKSKRVKKDITEFASQLIQTPSVSLREDKVASLVEQEMKSLGYDEVFQDDWGNVVGLIHGQTAEPTVLLNSHMDTTDAGEEGAWAFDPYSGKEEKGRLLGLGASDCKSGLASQIYAGAMLKHSLLPLRGNLVVAATVAEENGRSIGVRGLLDETLPSMEIKPDYCILGEPTDTGLYYGHDGWVNLDILVEGEQPFHVEDVANGIYRDLEENYFQRTPRENSEEFIVHPPHYAGAAGKKTARIQMSQKLYQGNDCGELVHNVKKNASYVAENYGAVAVKVDVKQESQRLSNGKTVMVQNVVNAWCTDPYHPLIERSRQTLAAAGLFVQPKKFQLNRLGMGTAGSILVNEYQIPTIAYGPGNLDASHAPNESVSIADMIQCTYGTAAVIHGLIGYPVFGWTSDEI